MKLMIVLTMLMAATLSYAQGQSQVSKSSGLAQELMQLQRAEDDAENKKDVAALDRLLSDDFIFTAPTGVLTDKRQLIEEIKTGAAEAGQAISYDEVKAHDYGKSAVVNYLLIVKGVGKDGKEYVNRFRNTVVWVRQQGRWRMAAIHVSRIRP